MSERLEERIRAAVRHIAEQPVVEPKVFVPQARTGRLRRLAPVAAAVAAVLATMVVTLAPGPGGQPAQEGGEPVLPREFAGMSVLTASLSDAPLGQPGIVVVGQYALGSLFGLGQVVIVGADGRTYRRVDLADERGATEVDGEWRSAEALLSPDGRRLAVGDNRGGATEIPVLDLVTGQRRDYRLPAPMAYQLKAWSLDGRKLAVGLEDTPERVADRFQSAAGYPLAILDLDTGALTTVPGVTADVLSTTVKFNAAGELGVTTIKDRGSSAPTAWLTVVAFDEHPAGKITNTMRLPDGWGFAGWSPAGDPILFRVGDDGVEARAVRLTDGSDIRPTVQIPTARASMIGWRTPTVMLVDAMDAGNGDRRIVAVNLESGEVEAVSTFENGFFLRTGNAVAASDLIAVAATASTDPERGPWPLWAHLALAFTAVLIAGLIAWRLRRRRK